MMYLHQTHHDLLESVDVFLTLNATIARKQNRVHRVQGVKRCLERSDTRTVLKFLEKCDRKPPQASMAS